jgi:hypothetical protein
VRVLAPQSDERGHEVRHQRAGDDENEDDDSERVQWFSPWT